MNRKYFSRTIFGAALLLLAACTNDELTDGDSLPEGRYPLQIGKVTLTAEVSEQPWTRVAETADGMGSEFKPRDEISVSLGSETAIYTYDGSKWTTTTPIYWQNTQPTTVTAKFPVSDQMDFTQQNTKGLTYVMTGSAANANYNAPANLTFKHQLAKVRVVLTGSNTDKVQAVSVYSYPTATRDGQGRLTHYGDPAYYPMHKATYNGNDYWEANMVPGIMNADYSFQITSNSGKNVNVKLDNNVTLTAGQVHTITIEVKSPVPDNAKPVTGDNISDNGNYVVRGNHTGTITITSGSPHIYLDNATVSVSSGNAINITGGNPTIHVVGENNSVTSSSGAGIYVAENSTVTVTSTSRNNVLTAKGGNGGNGIGGYSSDKSSTNSGDITISNVTIHAYGSDSGSELYAPGIGGAGSASCKTITIDNATVYAYGTGESYYNITGAAIGSGIYQNEQGSHSTITIRNNSNVNVKRGNYLSDYIGHSGSADNKATATDGIDATVDKSTVTKLN